jgi:hypothetical protein
MTEGGFNNKRAEGLITGGMTESRFKKKKRADVLVVGEMKEGGFN